MVFFVSLVSVGYMHSRAPPSRALASSFQGLLICFISFASVLIGMFNLRAPIDKFSKAVFDLKLGCSTESWMLCLYRRSLFGHLLALGRELIIDVFHVHDFLKKLGYLIYASFSTRAYVENFVFCSLV